MNGNEVFAAVRCQALARLMERVGSRGAARFLFLHQANYALLNQHKRLNLPPKECRFIQC